MTFNRANQSLAEARPYPVWQETRTQASAAPRLTGNISCDLAIVGGGFVGLWTALMARQRWPDATIVVLEAGQGGGEASGRNGGVCAPSISHGVSHAPKRWPQQDGELARLGRAHRGGAGRADSRAILPVSGRLLHGRPSHGMWIPPGRSTASTTGRPSTRRPMAQESARGPSPASVGKKPWSSRLRHTCH